LKPASLVLSTPRFEAGRPVGHDWRGLQLMLFWVYRIVVSVKASHDLTGG
jgi:hypothetical protein